MEYESLFKAARQAGTLLAETETERLGRTLMHAAQLLRTHTPRLLEANARDIEAMPASSPMLDRLRLTPERIDAIASDMEAIQRSAKDLSFLQMAYTTIFIGPPSEPRGAAQCAAPLSC